MTKHPAPSLGHLMFVMWDGIQYEIYRWPEDGWPPDDWRCAPASNKVDVYTGQRSGRFYCHGSWPADKVMKFARGEAL